MSCSGCCHGCSKSVLPPMKEKRIRIGDMPEISGSRSLMLNKGEDMCSYAPASGGYGVLRLGLVVPGSHVLFCAPLGCGRHGVIGSYFYRDTRERIHALYLTQEDLVLGSHLEQARDAALEVIRDYSPSCLTLIYSCVDDLLGSDYEALAQEIEETTHVPVRVAAMNPIRIETKRPPMPRALETAYSFINPCEESERDLSLLLVLGLFAGLDPESEIHSLLASRGFKLVDWTQCKTYQDFQELGRAQNSLVMGAVGGLAAKWLYKQRSITLHAYPVTVLEDKTLQQYAKLGDILGCELDTRAVYQDFLEQRAALLAGMPYKGLSVSVGSTHSYSPFELACLFAQMGARVTEIYTSVITPRDAALIKWLSDNSPETCIVPPESRTALNLHERKPQADLALGFDAAYYSNCTRFVPLSFESVSFGFTAQLKLLRAALEPTVIDNGFEEHLLQSPLVV